MDFSAEGSSAGSCVKTQSDSSEICNSKGNIRWTPDLLWYAYSRTAINKIWTLKNSKDLVESLGSQSLSVITSIKTFDFSTLCTTLLHPKLKSRLNMINFFIDNTFIECGDRNFQKTVSIPMGTNCTPNLPDLFLHS